MRHLVIINVGPIKAVDIELKRFNLFIGAQSSGKSTIAKILSTCSWVEKEVATTQDVNAIPDANTFKSLVENFHKMKGYFRDNSEVCYETDAIYMHYSINNFKIHFKSDAIYRRKKVCYIPSERNIVTLPELKLYEFKSTNLRSFLFDWLAAREFYSSINKTDNILDLGVRYFYNAEETLEQDRVVHSNGETYDISLPNASSGLQSVVPLFVLLEYYSTYYYDDYGKKESFTRNERERNLFLLLAEKYLAPTKNKENGSATQILKNCIAEDRNGNKENHELLMKFNYCFKSLIIPQSTDFIIEEPEQNLFPSTQNTLVDELVSICNNEKHKHGFTLTTHSPYILSSLNNLIYAYQVGQKFKDKVNEVIPEKCWVDPSVVCAWMVRDDGTVEDIIDPELKHIMAEKIDSASTRINELFNSLMDIDMYEEDEL